MSFLHVEEVTLTMMDEVTLLGLWIFTDRSLIIMSVIDESLVAQSIVCLVV